LHAIVYAKIGGLYVMLTTTNACIIYIKYFNTSMYIHSLDFLLLLLFQFSIYFYFVEDACGGVKKGMGK